MASEGETVTTTQTEQEQGTTEPEASGAAAHSQEEADWEPFTDAGERLPSRME